MINKHEMRELLQWMTRVWVFFSFVLFQAYLEAFYKFCTNLGGTTADTMCPILEVSKPLLQCILNPVIRC